MEKGILPDIKAEETAENFLAGQDRILKKAMAYSKPPETVTLKLG